jgi:hypothetical protein
MLFTAILTDSEGSCFQKSVSKGDLMKWLYKWLFISVLVLMLFGLSQSLVTGGLSQSLVTGGL